MSTAFLVPFRDRGIDPLRQANLDRVLHHWSLWSPGGGEWLVVDDGRDGDAQFNRSAAYNRGVAVADADVYVFTESDMLIRYDLIEEAIALALESPGLVVPFTQYRYLSADDSESVRLGAQPDEFTPELILDNGSSIGAINVVSRETMQLVGRWDEKFEGSWYDDDAMKVAFDVCAGPTRWVRGPAHHLYHLPAWRGDHLTAEDRVATQRNHRRYMEYQNAGYSPGRIRELTMGVR